MSRITIVNFSDSRGGAAIAVRQLVCGLRKFSCIQVRFVVAEKNINDSLSDGPSVVSSWLHFTKRVVAHAIGKLQVSQNNVKHSLNIFSSSHVVKKVNEGSDLTHFHWVNNETISLRQILLFLRNRGKRKVIFTLHDEWLLCGSEHIDLTGSERYKHGYKIEHSHNKLIDIDRMVFTLKTKFIPYLSEQGVVVTTPSRYLADMARESFLLARADVRVVPNVIDVDVFRHMNKNDSRRRFGISDDRFVLLFGSIGGGSILKGSDLLEDTLERLREFIDLKNIFLVTFGGQTAGTYQLHGYEALELGHVSDRNVMATVYNSADLTIVPSRKESFGQVAAESLACETAVVAFDNSGVADIVQHGQSGYLANAFDTDMMARSIAEFLDLSREQREDMGKCGREHIKRNFSEKVVCEQWLKIYRES